MKDRLGYLAAGLLFLGMLYDFTGPFKTWLDAHTSLGDIPQLLIVGGALWAGLQGEINDLGRRVKELEEGVKGVD